VLIDLTFIIKAIWQFRLFPVLAPYFSIFLMMMGELVIFAFFFFMQQFIFSVLGSLMFHDVASYATITESMLTIFKASAGVFNGDQLLESKEGPGWGYVFILTYMLLSFILIVNLIVGQLASAYKDYRKKKNVLMLLETLSVREASEADEKYSAAISPPYPLSIANLVFGTYILSVKNPLHNKMVLHLYFLPVMLCSLAVFCLYQVAVLPLAYIKTVGHKFALMVKNPKGTGSKSTSDRFGYAVFFLFLGPLILALDCLVDIYWFIKHTYMTDLDIIAQ